MTDDREARLPRWAQEELASLRRKVDALDRTVRELLSVNDGTATIVAVDHANKSRELVIPFGTIRFRTPRGSYDVYVDFGGMRAGSKDALVIVGEPSADGGMHIRPHCANVVIVDHDKGSAQ